MDEEIVKFLPLAAAALFYVLKTFLQQKKRAPLKRPELPLPPVQQPLSSISIPIPPRQQPAADKREASAHHNPVLFLPKKSTKAAKIRRLAKEGKSAILLSEILQNKF